MPEWHKCISKHLKCVVFLNITHIFYVITKIYLFTFLAYLRNVPELLRLRLRTENTATMAEREQILADFQVILLNFSVTVVLLIAELSMNGLYFNVYQTRFCQKNHQPIFTPHTPLQFRRVHRRRPS